MAIFSQSLFLQALGWATLNSFWQMAVLWILFVLAQHFFTLSSNKKFTLALLSLGAGLLWFIATFLTYYFSGAQSTLLASAHQLAPSSGTWSIVLSSASVAYLLLLVFPAFRLIQNWQYVKLLRTKGLEKTSLEYRLFVKKVAYRLGIQKPVHVYISSLITSPVTIGYIKPMILLPVAALNNLSVQQVEAILLHELSHIRRADFLINLIVSLLHTLFYYNPFVKKFVAAIEAEREKCCDETVLQFEYDKVSYAAALLTLEKNAASAQALAIGATGKHHLLKRIEKIVGMEKKPSFSFTHFASIMASLLLVILVNSMLFVSKPSERNKDLSFVALENPFFAIDRGDAMLTPPAQENLPAEAEQTMIADVLPAITEKQTLHHAPLSKEVVIEEVVVDLIPATEPAPQFVTVAFNEADQIRAAEEKNKVAATVEATKKVLAKTQWKEVEKEIADGMTPAEKEIAHQEYMQELEKVNWNALEETLKAKYQEIDWNKVSQSLNSALVAMELDSLQNTYSSILKQLEKAEAKAKTQKSCATVLPVPDASQTEIKAIKSQLRSRIDSINVIRNKKVISL